MRVFRSHKEWSILFPLNGRSTVMKRMYHFLVVGISIISLLSSCTTSLNVVNIDELHPADHSLPAGVRSVGVINNAVVDTMYYHPIRHYGNMRLEDRNTFLVPMGGYATVKNLSQNLADARYFSNVVIADSTLETRPSDYLYTRKDTLGQYILQPETVRALTDALGVDMLITYDYGQASVKVSPEYGYAEALLSSVFRTYTPDHKGPLYTFQDKDTIYWNNVRTLTLAQAKEAAATAIAETPVKHFVPQWQTTQRVYFASGNSHFKAAVPFIQKNEWNKAFLEWKKAYDGTKNERIRMAAAFNAALYFETHGNIGEAISWCDVAQSLTDESDTRNRRLITWYRSVLKKKQRFDKVLDQQIRRAHSQE